MQQSTSEARGYDDPLWDEVRRGLSARPKRLPAKLFYDARGSELFDRITELPEYYLTRRETAILDRCGAAVAERIAAEGPVVMIEPGCGASTKAAAILRHLRAATYVGLDISPEALASGAAALRRLVPGATVLPVPGDYTRPDWVPPELPPGHRVAFFPGSTLGNFEPHEAEQFLARLGRWVRGGHVVLGADPWKSPEILRPAYDDAQGVTAAFNRNALAHLVRRFGVELRPERFLHRVVVDEVRHRVEMHLESDGPQTLHLGDLAVRFEDGETIHTESCYKWPRSELRALARRAGLAVEEEYTDADEAFVVYLFRAVA